MTVDIDDVTMRRIEKIGAEWSLPPEAVVRAAVRAGVSAYRTRPDASGRH